MEIIIIASFVLFGLTGSGKSTLGNTVIGRNAFKEGAGIESQTNNVQKEKGIFDKHQVFVIDTPGLLDNNGRDQQHLDKITNCVKQHIGVKSFVIVIDFKNRKIDQRINKLFVLLEQMYPNKPWYNHIVIVWSNYESGLSTEKKNTLPLKQEGVKQVIKRIIPRISETELNSIPQYFIDNIEARNKNTESHQKTKEMIEWISTLPPLNKTLGIINNVDNDVMMEEIQEEERVIDDKVDGDIRTIIKSLFQRIKKTLYSGKVLYTDWKERREKRREERKQLMKPKPVSRTEYKDEIKVLGERRIVERTVKIGKRRWYRHRPKVDVGRILQKQQHVRMERTVTTYSDGNVTYTPWNIISNEIKEVEIGKFGYNLI